MENTLEDWQLALLVESKRLDDPTVVEAHEADALRDYKRLLDDARELNTPVAVEYDDAQTLDKADALLDAAQGMDEWELVDPATREAEQEALEAVGDLLSDALKAQHDLRDEVVDAMSVPSMVSQFRDEDDGTIDLDALSQHPETGGGAPDGDGDGDGGSSGDGGSDPLADVSAGDKKTAREKLDRADLMADRTPKYAESLRADAAALLGVDDLDEIDMEAL